jgi:acyl-homoserine lactone acylase PvdQ
LVTGGFKIIGQNGYYVMGVSICHSDNQDLYREKIEGDKYLLNGTWRDLKIRNEVIYVKTSEGLIKEEIQVR